MGIFRKKETYNAQMLREAGLDRVVFTTPEPAVAGMPEPDVPAPAFDRSRLPLQALHGSPGPRSWDFVTTVVAPGIEGDRVSFTVLPNSDLIVDGDEDDDLSVLADAIEQNVSPPYKANATRQDGDLWGVGASRIDVAAFPFPGADALELSRSDGVVELRADGAPSDAAAPVELQRLGEQAGADFCVEAERIDGDNWEVKASPL